MFDTGTTQARATPVPAPQNKYKYSTSIWYIDTQEAAVVIYCSHLGAVQKRMTTYEAPTMLHRDVPPFNLFASPPWPLAGATAVQHLGLQL